MWIRLRALGATRVRYVYRNTLYARVHAVPRAHTSDFILVLAHCWCCAGVAGARARTTHHVPATPDFPGAFYAPVSFFNTLLLLVCRNQAAIQHKNRVQRKTHQDTTKQNTQNCVQNCITLSAPSAEFHTPH